MMLVSYLLKTNHACFNPYILHTCYKYYEIAIQQFKNRQRSYLIVNLINMIVFD